MTDPLPPVAQDGRWTVDEGLAWVDPNGRRWTLDPDDLAQIWTAAPDPTVAAACASLVALADRVCDLEQDNEGLSRHTAFMERYRMRATRLGGEAEALLDAVKDRLDQETGDDATPDSFHEGFVDALTRMIAHPAAVRLRALLADPPTPERNDA